MKAESLEYVGFWPRVGAALIDVLLLCVMTFPLMYMIYGQISSPRMFTVPDILINYLLPGAVTIVLWVFLGATPGKMAMSARIVDADTGEPLAPDKAVIRYLGYYVSLLALGVGYIWIAFDRRKQGWHDKMANSVVVRPAGIRPVAFQAKRDWRQGGVDPRM